MNRLKSVMAARELGIPYSHLASLLRSGKFPAPQKDSSGDYLWSEQNLEEARRAMGLDRRRKAVRDASGVAVGEKTRRAKANNE
jgi:hypothetical protein